VVIWTELAKADLRAIHDFIAHDSRYYAKKVVQDIREEIEGLARIFHKFALTPHLRPSR
jgi:plasmid stabilization system protein ParE